VSLIDRCCHEASPVNRSQPVSVCLSVCQWVQVLFVSLLTSLTLLTLTNAAMLCRYNYVRVEHVQCRQLSLGTVQLECSLPQGSHSLGRFKFIIYSTLQNYMNTSLDVALTQYRGSVLRHQLHAALHSDERSARHSLTQAKQKVAAIAGLTASQWLRLNPDKAWDMTTTGQAQPGRQDTIYSSVTTR